MRSKKCSKGSGIRVYGLLEEAFDKFRFYVQAWVQFMSYDIHGSTRNYKIRYEKGREEII